MFHSIEVHHQRVRSLRGIVKARWFLLGGLGFLGAVQISAGLAAVSLTWWSWSLLVVIPLAYNSVYQWMLRRPAGEFSSRTISVLSLLQIVIDQVVFTAIVYVTGGVESVAFMLYAFPILSATILYADLQIISLSLLTVFWYVVMVALEFFGALPHLSRYHHEPLIYGNAEATIANTLTISMVLLFVGLFAVFVNRIILDRERQIMLERDKVRAILNSLENGIVMLDTKRRVLLMNPPARDMLRVYDDELGPELRKADFNEPFHELIASIRQLPETKLLGQEVVVKEGSHDTHIQVDTIPIHSADGTILSWIKVLQDVTREKELDSIKSDFISIAAHQLRTPLAALKWFFRSMLDGDAGPLQENQIELLEKAFRRNDEVIDIVNNLLDISEIEEGRFPYALKEGSVLPMLDDVFRTVEGDAVHKRVTVIFNRPEDGAMPPIKMDKQKMRIAVQNLLDNAVKYSPKEGSVTLTAEKKNNRFFITVSDEGIGIPESEQPKIFSKFFRGDTAKEKETTGSGLGLYIVRNIVQRHRGQIWFESKQGKGTTFYISLPIPPEYLESSRE